MSLRGDLAMFGDDGMPVCESLFAIDVNYEYARRGAGPNPDQRARPFLPPCADLIFVRGRLVETAGAVDRLAVGVLVARGQWLLSPAWENMPTEPRIV